MIWLQLEILKYEIYIIHIWGFYQKISKCANKYPTNCKRQQILMNIPEISQSTEPFFRCIYESVDDCLICAHRNIKPTPTKNQNILWYRMNGQHWLGSLIIRNERENKIFCVLRRRSVYSHRISFSNSWSKFLFCSVAATASSINIYHT